MKRKRQRRQKPDFPRPVPLDIVADGKGARITFADTRFEARIVADRAGPEVEIEATGIGTHRLGYLFFFDLEALRADLALGAELWLNALESRTLGLYFGKGDAPSGAHFVAAWDRHRRLWMEAHGS